MTATYNGSMNDHSSGTSRPTRSPNQFGKEPQAEYQRRIKQGVHFKAASCIRNFRAAVAQVELPDQACGTCQYHGRRHEPIEGRPYPIARSAVVVYRRNDKVHGHGENQQESVCARNALNSSHDPFISFSFPRLAAIAGGASARESTALATADHRVSADHRHLTKLRCVSCGTIGASELT